jgi:hypothetical protein
VIRAVADYAAGWENADFFGLVRACQDATPFAAILESLEM